MKLRSVDRAISVQSSNIDLGDALSAHARQSILRVAGKYFGRLSTAVHFTREGTSYRCTVNMQMGALKMTSAEGTSTEIYAAFNAALERVATQLRRAKRTFRDEKGSARTRIWLYAKACVRRGWMIAIPVRPEAG